MVAAKNRLVDPGVPPLRANIAPGPLRSHHSCFLAIVLIAAATAVGDPAAAVEPLTVRTDLPRVSLGPHTEAWFDDQATATITEAIHPEMSDRYHPIRIPTSYGRTAGAAWLRFSLRNPSSAPFPVHVEFAPRSLDRIDFYEPAETEGHRKWQLGRNVNSNERVAMHSHHALRVLVPAESTQTYYARLTTEGILIVAPAASGQAAFEVFLEREAWKDAFLYGALASLIVVAIVFFAFRRDSASLYYCLFGSAFLAYLVWNDGIAHRSFPSLVLLSYYFLPCVTLIFAMQFSRRFLDSRYRAPRLDLSIRMALGVGLLLAGSTPFLSPVTTGQIFEVFMPISALLMLAAGIQAFRAGFTPALWYLLSWSGALLLLVVRAFGSADIITDWPGGRELFRYSVLLQMSILVPALGQRLRLLEETETHLRGVAVDAQQQRALAQERYEQLVETSPFGVLVVEPDFTITHANSSLIRMLGAPDLTSLIGQRLDDAQNISGEILDAVRASLEDRAATVLETHIETSWQQSVDLRVHVAPVHNSAGDVVACQLISEDITEAQDLRVQLQRAQRLEAVARLAAGVAHDFNNYLTAILGFGELARQANPKDPSLPQVVAAAERASSVTRQLLAFSRQQVTHPRVVDVCAVVRELDELLERLVGEDKELRLSLDPDQSCTRIDPGQLEQVVVNLVVNARDAMPLGGTIAIRVEKGPDPTEILLSVSDTGEGMDADTQSHIFDPFFTTKEVNQGTGLGLATVHGIVEESGGRIELESAPGEGTTFRILLPLAPEADLVTEAEESVSVTPSLKAATVLVVDDDASLRLLARRVLEGAGHQVIEAKSPAEALEIGRSVHSIDLLLTDIVMPKMSGLELSRRLTASNPGLITLFTSGYMDRTEVEEILQREPNAFLEKPFSAADLAARVEERLLARAATAMSE